MIQVGKDRAIRTEDLAVLLHPVRRPVGLGHREGRRREAVPLVGDRDSVVVADVLLLVVNRGIVGEEDEAVSGSSRGDVDGEGRGWRSGVVSIFGRGEGGEGVETLRGETGVIAEVAIVEGAVGGGFPRRRGVVAVVAEAVEGRRHRGARAEIRIVPRSRSVLVEDRRRRLVAGTSSSFYRSRLGRWGQWQKRGRKLNPS